MRGSFGAVALAVLFAAAEPADAQLFYVGVRGGAGIPTGSFADSAGGTTQQALLAGAKAGFGYGLDAGIGFGPLGVYAGVDRIQFQCHEDSCDSSGKYKLAGVSAGVRLSIPLIPLLKPWAKAGLTFNELEGTLGGSSGGARITTDRAPGYELGAGVDIPVMVFFSLTPQVRYVRQKLKYEVPSLSVPTRGEKKANYYTFDLGLRLRSPM